MFSVRNDFGNSSAAVFHVKIKDGHTLAHQPGDAASNASAVEQRVDADLLPRIQASGATIIDPITFAEKVAAAFNNKATPSTVGQFVRLKLSVLAIAGTMSLARRLAADTDSASLYLTIICSAADSAALAQVENALEASASVEWYKQKCLKALQVADFS